MTSVTIYRNKHNEYLGFTVIGHSGYAEAGADIICASISMLVINTINSIEVFTEDKVNLISNEEEGLIDYRLKDSYTDKTQLLLSSMVLGLSSIVEDEDYKKFIQLRFEEV